MAAQVQWSGLAALREQLRKLPADFRDEGGAIVFAHAQRAYALIQAGYPEYTGNLKRGLRIDYRTGKNLQSEFGVGVVVRNRAKHAWLFENGTAGKIRFTRTGAARGPMPPGKVFIPIAIRVRAQMYRQLEALLRRSGLQVVGHAG